MAFNRSLVEKLALGPAANSDNRDKKYLILAINEKEPTTKQQATP